MATDRELVDMQSEVWASIEALGAQLDETGWATPTECPGWTVQDNLVHVTAIESLILERPLPTQEPPDQLPHVKNDTGKANERWVEARRSWSGADAFAEFRAVTWVCIWLENVRKAMTMLKNGENAFTIGQALRIWPRDVQQKFVDTAGRVEKFAKRYGSTKAVRTAKKG